MNKKQSLVAFENTQINIGFNNNEIEMDMEELAKAIGATIHIIKHQLARNTELQEEEFSYLKKVDSLENGVIKKREKRFFTEQGIYEITLLARTEKAKRFRKFARELITKYRKNEIVVKTAISAKTNEKLDHMIELLKERDSEIENFGEILEYIKEKLEKLDKIEVDVAILKEMADEAAKEISFLRVDVDNLKARQDDK